MRLTTLVAAAAMACVPAVSLQAQYFNSTPVANRDATPFWDVISQDDGAGCNIGFVLAGPIPSCNFNQVSPSYVAPGTPSWYGHAWANPAQSFGFGFFTSAGANLSYFGGVAGANPLAKLYVRDLMTNTILFTFTGATPAYTVAAGTYFDIGIASYNPLSAVPNFFSYSSSTPNQFAVFGNGSFDAFSASCGSACWVGAEDDTRLGNGSDYDYNDGILKITGANVIVPEPSTYALMASGLLALAAVARRRKSKVS